MFKYVYRKLKMVYYIYQKVMYDFFSLKSLNRNKSFKEPLMLN